MMADMITIQRANVVLTVPADRKSEYMGKGYSVINANTGEVLEAAMPTDVHELQRMVKALQDKVAMLEGEIKKKSSTRSKKSE